MRSRETYFELPPAEYKIVIPQEESITLRHYALSFIDKIDKRVKIGDCVAQSLHEEGLRRLGYTRGALLRCAGNDDNEDSMFIGLTNDQEGTVVMRAERRVSREVDRYSSHIWIAKVAIGEMRVLELMGERSTPIVLAPDRMEATTIEWWTSLLNALGQEPSNS